MKHILREICVYSFTLFVCEQLFRGFRVDGGMETYIIASLIFIIGFKILKPIFSILTFPLHLASLGLFSYVILALILYLITKLYTKVHVSSFVISHLSFFGLELNGIRINSFLAYFVISGTIYLLSKLIGWLFDQ